MATVDNRWSTPASHLTAAYSVTAYASAATLVVQCGIESHVVAVADIKVRTQSRFMPFADVQPMASGTHYFIYARRVSETNVGDGVTFMQRATSADQDREPVEDPDASKMTFQDLGACLMPFGKAMYSLPIMHAHPQVLHSQLPVALFGLLHAWIDRAIVEVEGSPPVAYIETWYVHHVECPACYISRGVVLRSDLSTWVSDIVQAWQDHMQWQQPFRLHYVMPTPPISQLQSNIGHVIIEQGLQCPRAAVLFCRLAVEVLPIGCEKMKAVSLGHHQNKETILQAAYADMGTHHAHDHSLTQVLVKGHAVAGVRTSLSCAA